jgi:hypothetical protein
MTQAILAAAAVGFVVRPFWVLTAAAVAANLDVIFSSGRYW